LQQTAKHILVGIFLSLIEQCLLCNPGLDSTTFESLCSSLQFKCYG